MSDRSTRHRRRLISALVLVAFGVMTQDKVLAATRGSSAPVQIPSVSSTDQHNGVTAGYVNQLTVVPLVPTPQLEAMKSLWTRGAQLYRVTANNVETDTQIDDFAAKTDAWVNETYQWLRKNISEYAAERFAFRPSVITFTWTLSGDHKPGYAKIYGTYYNALSTYLLNLDQIMRDPSAYPGGVPK